MNSSPGLSIFYPAYNEAPNLPDLIAHAAQFVQTQSFPVEVIVVDDGSRDNSRSVMEELSKKYSFLRYVRHEKNKGYGEALRTGFQAANAPLVFFTDGDFQFRLQELPAFLNLIQSDSCDAVIGYRANRQDNALRKLNALLWGLLIRILLGVKARDIDCAYKLIRKQALESLVFTTTGAMISTELLFHLQSRRCKIKELPVNHYERTKGAATGARFSVILRAFKELFQFYLRSRPSVNQIANET